MTLISQRSISSQLKYTVPGLQGAQYGFGVDLMIVTGKNKSNKNKPTAILVNKQSFQKTNSQWKKNKQHKQMYTSSKIIIRL